MNIDSLRSNFIQVFDETPKIFRAPGRVNIIGEHTDYNDGLVLPFPIKKAIYFAASRREDDEIHVHALDLDKSTVINIKNLTGYEAWTRYFVGAIEVLLLDDHQFKGMNLMLRGDIPFGAGISSSSALTCGFIYTIKSLFQLDISKREIVFLASRAENGTGVNGGKMDQFAICMGKQNNAILLDCRDYSYQLIDSQIPGASWYLFNTMVEHNLAETAYNDRRKDCEDALQIIKSKNQEINSIRDLSLDLIDSNSTSLSQTQYERVLHVIKENERVLEMVNCLAEENLQAAGTLMFDSHMSLSNLYEVSCPELDFIVDGLSTLDGCYGARMMGGGFGGSVIALMKDQEYDFSSLEQNYNSKFGLNVQIFPVASEDGISEVPDFI